MILLTGIIVNAIVEDADGPLIYEIDILPVQPVAGDIINVVIYCVDRSGVSGAQLSSTLDGETWTVLDMQFFACLCIAGGRWVGTFGPVSDSDNARFFVTAFDSAPIRNAAISQTFSIQLTTI